MNALVPMAAAPSFTAPHLEYSVLLPILVVFGIACVGILVEAFAPRERRFSAQVGLTLVGLVVALVRTVMIGVDLRPRTVAEGAIVIDGPGIFLWGVILVVAIGGVLLFAERQLDGGVSAFAGQAAALPGTAAERTAAQQGLDHTEVYPLLLFAVGGMMLFPVAGDLLMLFVALEVLSLPLYLLVGLARRRRLLSQEAALKYFLLGAFSSGFFLYGLALVYGYAGTMDLAGIGQVVHHGGANHALLIVGMGLMGVGLLFKVGAVPFHAWTPDVYQGAPTAVTAWMSAATKVAAFGALLRLFAVAFGNDRLSWQPVLGVIAIVTMLFGAAIAVVQTDVKRMLAYSAVAHTGFLLTGVVGYSASGRHGEDATQAVLFYLVAYSVATIGAFALVTVVRDSNGEATSFAKWTGLGKRSPLVAVLFALFLFSMAGIPLTGGFIGKWEVFTVALRAGYWPVVGVAIAASIISVFFYVRFVLLLFFLDRTVDEHGAAGVEPTVAVPAWGSIAVIGVCAAATLFLGIVPDPVLHLIENAGSFLG
jgi:NADH-quinone oxidoreductase subunit N